MEMQIEVSDQGLRTVRRSSIDERSVDEQRGQWPLDHGMKKGTGMNRPPAVKNLSRFYCFIA